MEFTSFEEALHVCMTAEPESAEQDAALAYCLENAPPELKEKIMEGLAKFHNTQQDTQQTSCGCKHDH